MIETKSGESLPRLRPPQEENDGPPVVFNFLIQF